MADVRFDATAIADVTLARDWYEGELAGLGKEFVNSVEVNEQWRIVFRWDKNNARDVRLTDYQK